MHNYGLHIGLPKARVIMLITREATIRGNREGVVNSHAIKCRVIIGLLD